MTCAVYIIGAPGSGKSTRMAELLTGWTVGPYTKWTAKEMFGHHLQHPQLGHGAYLGHLRPEYPGTDALSQSVSPQAKLWLQALPLLGLDWVFGEGVRLGNIGFLVELAAVSDLTVLYMNVPPEVAAERRERRGGKLMSDTWCKIATSRAVNTAARCREAGIAVEEVCS